MGTDLSSNGGDESGRNTQLQSAVVVLFLYIVNIGFCIGL